MSGYNKDTFAANLRASRARLGINQGELAETVGVNTTTVSSWERGENVPTANSLYALANALGTTPNDLLGWTA